MLSLNLDELRAGMVLGQDILGTQGQLLLRAGATLNDKHIQVLRINQIKTILIGADAEPAAGPALDTAEVEARLNERFRISDANHPLIQELRRLCHQRLSGPQGGSESD